MAASMIDRSLLFQIELSLSEAWGGEVRLLLQKILAETPHVIRLRCIQAPDLSPPTVIVKKNRFAGQNSVSDVGLHNLFFRDWASLEFLQNIMGDETVAPRVFTGNKDEGYFVMEDLGNEAPLVNVLRNGAFSEASQAMSQYGALLGLLHGVSAGKSEPFNQVYQKMMAGCCLEPEKFHHLFEMFIQNLRKLEIVFPATALDELWDAAEILEHTDRLNVFTHGDPVGGNILNSGGRWRMVDFEAGRFQNGFIEGVFPRMIFPTSGLDMVMGMPEKAWRAAETEYLLKVGETIPEVQDEVVRGVAITAACAFWLLVTWDSWMEHALVGDFSADRVRRVRQCVIARMERFIITSHEFRGMTRLGDEIEKLVRRLRSVWPNEDCDLPFYPAFF